ncbi:stimulator of interferon genes protein-like isoform X1 [Galleria mellonella]|uniref:Stimulator of interferon genes protein-like isoform X1 n=1 Tax=Galleria mellonella TaxID=7137 RepID=A0ABM3MII2_GALME|nr:stimulator of interferon genes protein-like isoform X1 [Galleria mellonella]
MSFYKNYFTHKYHYILFVLILAFYLLPGSGNVNVHDTQKLLTTVVRYIFYLFFIRGSQAAIVLIYKIHYWNVTIDLQRIIQKHKTSMYIFGASLAVLIYNRESLFREDFFFLFAAQFIEKYLNMEHSPTSIRYGIGMACSFFEGYLTHVLPSDGARFVGFAENIAIYEANQGVVFPVKKLFIIITKSMYCPPDLKQFNKPNRTDLARLEACESLSDVEKDVAGVKNRTYRNSAYKIHRPGSDPVYLAAECATPLHTLHLVLQKRALFEELKNIDVEEVVNDFCTMLRSIISKSHDCHDKCELVYFDNTNPDLNLADVLLDKIRELEPNFENIRLQ